MRFFTAAFGLLGLAATALATTADFHAITKPGMGETVKAGDVYTIEWNYSDMYEGQVTLELLGGDSQGTLTSIATLGTTDGKNGALAWAVSDNLGDLKVYGLRISLADDPNTFQYSTPFSIQGDGSKASTTSESETMTTTSAESSSTDAKHSKTKTTTTTSSSSSSSSSTSSTESSTSSAPSTSTTFVIVTTSRSDFTTSPLTQVTTSASETATSTSKPDSRGPISGGAIAGIAAGGVAGLAVLLGMLSMTFKLIRQRRQEAYENM